MLLHAQLYAVFRINIPSHLDTYQQLSEHHQEEVRPEIWNLAMIVLKDWANVHRLVAGTIRERARKRIVPVSRKMGPCGAF